AKQLNGTLRLMSELGRGTRAELWLPVSTVAAKTRPQELVEGSDAQTVPRIKVLVVDDDALIAMSTVDMLEDLGHEVIVANSGARALEIFRKGQVVDLLLTDYSMPKMTGVQLAQAARELQPNLLVLLATGYAELPSGSEIDAVLLSRRLGQQHLREAIL
ncbi:MAG: response regulator, partial [Chthoniobacteraceae bacterium]